MSGISFQRGIKKCIVRLCILLFFGGLQWIMATVCYAQDTLIYSTNTIDIQNLSCTPFISVQQLLKGNVAGVYVQENTGEPGAIQNILIRGLSAPAFSNKDFPGVLPAVYLNGIPLIQENPMLYDIKQYDINPIGAAANVLAGLNIASIESFRIIKDPLELAKLGPLASNGAVWITTKDGYYGGKNVSAGVFLGMAFAPTTVKMTNGTHEKAFRQRFYDAYQVATENRHYPDYLLDARDLNYFGNPDWAESYYQSSPLYNINASIGGGAPTANYVFLLAHTRDAGVANETSYSKYNVSFALNMRPLDELNVNTFINVAKIDRERNLHFRDRYAEMEYLVDFSTPIAPSNNTYTAFLADNALTKDDNFNNLMNGQLTLKYTKNRFYADAKFQMDYTTDVRRAFWPTTLMESVSFVSNFSGYNRRVIGDASVGYIFDLAGIHRWDIHWNGSILSDLYHYNYTRAFDGDDDKKPTTSSGNFKQYRYVDRLENKLVSTSFSLDYKYKNWYSLDVLLRYDGNSNVQPDKRWIFTPSFSAKWNLKNQLFTSAQALSDLAINISWARVGKQLQSDLFAMGPRYTSSNINWDGQALLSSGNGYAVITRPYELGWVGYDLGWPLAEKINVELNASFLNNRIQTSVSVYENRDKNLVTQIQVPQEFGYKYRFAEGMEVGNKGLELSLSASLLSGSVPEKLKWDLSFNAAYNRNELKKLPEGLSEIVIGDHKLQVGQSIDAFWVYRNEGVYARDEEVPSKEGKLLSIGGIPFQKGDPRWVDVDANNAIDSDDRVLKGHALPPFTGGITNNFAYKRFDFGFHFFFASGHSALNLRDQQRYDFMTLDNLPALRSVKEIFFWQNTNQKDDYPVYNPLSNVHPYRAEQDIFLEKLSYLKLRNVTLGYTLSLKKVKDRTLESLYFYFTANNLFTVSGFTGDDPELVNFNGAYDGYSLPIPRSVSMGVRFKF
ncbi:MAG: SusC/RagA family TonB-linked outer membrane protein [Dysgonamonadaceae bacterium]|jgi:TonB-linked SusC/RagA family outer membrane protein|nr:SusC/RagA family TonB-linked outer membrane protein [Dysgonamonadaceae bacterium]